MHGHRKFKKLEDVDKSLARYLSKLSPINRSVYLPPIKSFNRVLYEDVLSPGDLPPFDRSAMDGYAVRSVDVSSASPTNPVKLRLIGYSTTGESFKGIVGSGEAVKIDTGAEMPRGADAVVMKEFVEEEDGYIYVFKSVSRFENVSVRGEDLRKGDVVLPRGALITEYDLPALLSIGVESVRCYDLVKVGIVSFGDELVEEDNPPPGFIRETNRAFLKHFLSKYPVVIRDYGIRRDDVDVVRDTLLEMAGENDVVISTGGTSLGDDDVVGRTAYEIGVVDTHGVALQPSKPVLLGFIGGKPYIGLPGYPVAVAVSSHAFLEPIITRLSGIIGEVVYPVVKGVLTRRVASKPGFKHYVRVRVRKVEGRILIEPIYASGAGVLSSLSLGDGYLIVPGDVEGFEKGSVVEAVLYRRVLRNV